MRKYTMRFRRFRFSEVSLGILGLVICFLLVGCNAEDAFDTEASGDVDLDPSSSQIRDEIGDGLQTFFEDLHSAGRFSGAAVVAREGRIVYQGAWGFSDLSLNREFTLDTPVDGASLAKTFVAASVWQLIHQGKLELDEQVSRYIAEFPSSEVTVRHLLEHSAGLPEWAEIEGRTNSDLIVQNEPVLNFPPGSRFSYCNECFDVLALVTERISGESWEHLLQRLYFEPLAMGSAFLRPPLFADWPGPRTLGYRADGKTIELLDVYDNEAFYGSSNLYFSARDLHLWAEAFLNDNIVPSDVIASGLEIAELDGELSALNRLNWYYQSPRGPFHFNGHLAGFHHDVYWDPLTKLSIVWVSNVSGTRPLPQLITRAVVHLGQGRPIDDLPPLTFVPGPVDRNDEAMAGVYRLPHLGLITIYVEDSGPMVQVNKGPRHMSYPSEGFYVPDFDAEIGFSELGQDGYERLHWLTVFEEEVGVRVGL